MCTILANDIEVIVAGGQNWDGKSVNTTWIFNLTSQKWSKGPDLKGPRSMHGCAKFYSQYHNKEIIVAAGGIHAVCNNTKKQSCAKALKSVEIIASDELSQWTKGKVTVLQNLVF